MGLTSAKADNHIYTRKRVNGRWITGRWERKSAKRKPAPAKVPPPAVQGRAPRQAASLRETKGSHAEGSSEHELLRSKLEAQARKIAAALGTSHPRSVSFDFETGMKTVIFSDGARTEEPFDREAVERLLSPTVVGSDE